eukprot:906033-Rhodomonas_salina.3
MCEVCTGYVFRHNEQHRTLGQYRTSRSTRLGRYLWTPIESMPEKSTVLVAAYVTSVPDMA